MKRLFVVVLAFLVLASGVISCATTQAPTTTPAPTPEPAPSPQSPPTQPEPSPPFTQATVARVIDGDTIEVDIGGRPYKVRYIGIDTPEIGQPGYDEATLANAALVAGKTVYLEKDVSETDRYGRLLRYVWTEEGMVNAHLVAMGYAQVSTYPPDVKYQQDFLELQRVAEEASAGLWTVPQLVPSAGGVFVGSVNSDVYHYPSCTYAQRINPENQIWFTSSDDAREHGYRPCKVCRPP